MVAYDFSNLNVQQQGNNNCFSCDCDECVCDCDNGGCDGHCDEQCDCDNCDSCDCDVCNSGGCDTCDYSEE